MSERRRPPLIPPWLFPVVGLPLAWWLFGHGSQTPLELALGVTAILVGSLLRVPAGSGNSYSMAVAVAAALPFLYRTGTDVDLWSTIGVHAVGFAGVGLLRAIRGTSVSEVTVGLLRRVAGTVTFAIVLDLAGNTAWTAAVEEGWRDLGPVAAATTAWLAVEVGVWAIARQRDRRLSRRYLALLALKDANVFVALAATGSLFGIAFESLGWWALAIAVLPYSFAHAAFRRYQSTKQTYRQTIRALARIPEVAGLATEGHADRTTDLAVEVAEDLALIPKAVAEVEYAALMHDIGRIALSEPTVVRMGYTDEDIARWGSEIIGEASFLERVAHYVRQQNQPYRRPGEERDPDLPMASKIVLVCSTYDHAIADRGSSPLEAMEELHRGAAYTYDPVVVGALRQALDRRHAFRPSSR